MFSATAAAPLRSMIFTTHMQSGNIFVRHASVDCIELYRPQHARIKFKVDKTRGN